MQIIKLDRDLRMDKDNTKVCICCPVGDSAMFTSFVKMMHKLGISMDTNIDFLFVAPPGLELSPMMSTLSAIYYRENIVKLGTSGSFFACQVAAYELNYEIIIVTDIDVEMDDAKVLYDCIALAKKTGKIVMPQCRARTTNDDTTSSSVWGFGTFPRKMIDKHGFCTPYFWKGSEDYDYNVRVFPDKLEYRGGMIYHPRVGNIYYTKAVDPKKFFPYLGSLMKNFLLQKKYLHYEAWFVYNMFLADVFTDFQLRHTMLCSNDIEHFPTLLANTHVNALFKITKIKEQGTTTSKAGMLMAMIESIDNFIMAKPFRFYTDEIEYLGDRGELILNLINATFMIPIRAMQGIWNIMTFKKNVAYPIYTENIREAEQWMLQNFPRWG
jgi:hypothetical protein